MNRRKEWLFSDKKTHILDKNYLIDDYIDQMLNRTNNMFSYENLPDTIPQEELELLLQTKGFAIITKVNNKFYAFYGGLGGLLDEYYRPTIATVNNPYLKYSNTLEINKDCVIIRNDVNYKSLYSLYEKYAILLADCDISIRNNLINTRLHKVLYSSDINIKESIDKLYEQIEKGSKPFSILSSLSLDNEASINSVDFNTNSCPFTELIELRNYLKANWFIDLGLNYNYNMKRESINEFEASMNDDSLLPFVEHMLYIRKKDIENLNKLFNLNIGVRFNSSWYQEFISNEKTTEQIENLNKEGLKENGDIQTAREIKQD